MLKWTKPSALLTEQTDISGKEKQKGNRTHNDCCDIHGFSGITVNNSYTPPQGIAEKYWINSHTECTNTIS